MTPAGAAPGAGAREGFHVRLCRATQQAVVHLAGCPHCRGGRGHPRQDHRPKEDTWSGPCRDREAAFRLASSSGLRRVRGCGHCRP